jgi:hypothetical protein
MTSTMSCASGVRTLACRGFPTISSVVLLPRHISPPNMSKDIVQVGLLFYFSGGASIINLHILRLKRALLPRTDGAINPAQLQVIENLDVVVSVTEKI